MMGDCGPRSERRGWSKVASRVRQVLRAVPLAALAATALALAATTAQAAPHLTYSTASNGAVQTQPAPGTCHAMGTGLYSRPDPSCTPGALNPSVTQADIGRTICRAGWTGTTRPPEAITEAEKRASILAYGDTRPLGDYEYDHFVPLELGGATNAAANLWPEPGASPNPKDRVENELNHAVCDHHLSLATAQEEIVTNWVKLAMHGLSLPPPTAHPKPPQQQPPPPPPPPSAWCSASASWNNQYDDYDVYVNSNQPDQYATVTGAGQTDGYETNNSGYADVYFYENRSDAGDEINVQVGSARCSTAL
jgi:hypothetical protein